MKRGDAPAAVVARVRRLCMALPQVVEEAAWAGTRWSVRKKTFAHVLRIEAGWPPVYAKAAGELAAPGPADVLTFRSPLCAMNVHAFDAAPFFKPPWFADIAAVVLGNDADWDGIEALLRQSWQHLAPKALVSTMQSASG